jgi:hypothetical protein
MPRVGVGVRRCARETRTIRREAPSDTTSAVYSIRYDITLSLLTRMRLKCLLKGLYGVVKAIVSGKTVSIKRRSPHRSTPTKRSRTSRATGEKHAKESRGTNVLPCLCTRSSYLETTGERVALRAYRLRNERQAC